MADGVRIGVLLSGRGRGTNLQAILAACADGRIPGRVAVVISIREADGGRSPASPLPGAPALDRAREAGVPAVTINPARFPDPESLDRELIRVLDAHGVDLVALAGYMRLLGPELLARFPGQVMNTHAALLPCFGGRGFYGRRVHEAVIESGTRFSGATIHFVDEEYDHGPIIVQAVVPVHDDDSPDTLAARVLEQEHRLYVEAIRLYAEGRLEVCGRRVRIRRE